MASRTLGHQQEFGYETAEEQRRRVRAELLRRAGVRPAPGSMLRNDRVTVEPVPKLVRALAKLLP
jgi:hypothetical protein